MDLDIADEINAPIASGQAMHASIDPHGQTTAIEGSRLLSTPADFADLAAFYGRCTAHELHRRFDAGMSNTAIEAHCARLEAARERAPVVARFEQGTIRAVIEVHPIAGKAAEMKECGAAHASADVAELLKLIVAAARAAQARGYTTVAADRDEEVSAFLTMLTELGTVTLTDNAVVVDLTAMAEAP